MKKKPNSNSSAGTAADSSTQPMLQRPAKLLPNPVLAEVLDMWFEHDYARSKSMLKVVYIEYIDGKPHSVTASHEGFQSHFDYEDDCKECGMFMFYHSGSSGKITDLQAPHFIDGANASYWMHPTAKFKGKTKAINATRLDSPIEYNGNPNPFENGREIYGQDYCKFCEKWYDEDACPEHHIVNDDGELEYFDGSPVEN